MKLHARYRTLKNRKQSIQNEGIMDLIHNPFSSNQESKETQPQAEQKEQNQAKNENNQKQEIPKSDKHIEEEKKSAQPQENQYDSPITKSYYDLFPAGQKHSKISQENFNDMINSYLGNFKKSYAKQQKKSNHKFKRQFLNNPFARFLLPFGSLPSKKGKNNQFMSYSNSMAETIDNDNGKVKRIIMGQEKSNKNGKKQQRSYHKADDMKGNNLSLEDELQELNKHKNVFNILNPQKRQSFQELLPQGLFGLNRNHAMRQRMGPNRFFNLRNLRNFIGKQRNPPVEMSMTIIPIGEKTIPLGKQSLPFGNRPMNMMSGQIIPISEEIIPISEEIIPIRRGSMRNMRNNQLRNTLAKLFGLNRNKLNLPLRQNMIPISEQIIPISEELIPIGSGSMNNMRDNQLQQSLGGLFSLNRDQSNNNNGKYFSFSKSLGETISNDGGKNKRVMIGSEDIDNNGKKSHKVIHKADDLQGNQLSLDDEQQEINKNSQFFNSLKNNQENPGNFLRNIFGSLFRPRSNQLRGTKLMIRL